MSTIFVFVQVSYDFEPPPAGPVAPDAPTACGCMACDGQASISSPPARLPCILLPCSPQPAACSPQPSAMQPAARCPANASRCPTSPYPASCCLATRYLAARSLLPSTVAYVAQEGPPNAAPSAFGWPAIARWGPQMPPLNANGQRWQGGGPHPDGPANCGWPTMARWGPPNAPAARGWPEMARWGPPEVPTSCGWPAMARVGAPDAPAEC
jgi:hypothetical protein